MTLRGHVLRGGMYLVLRQGVGMVINLAGILLLTRIIGPARYGLFAAAYGVFFYLQIVCQLGIGVYLVRHPATDPAETRRIEDQAFTLLVMQSAAGAVLALCLTPVLATWIRIDGFGPVAGAMFALLPVVLLAQVPLARLERALNYRGVAYGELAGLIVLHTVAIALALRGAGVWAPVVGWAAQQVTLFTAFHAIAGYRPRFVWSAERSRAMLAYGFDYASSTWMWLLRQLVNPLIVGRYAGAEVVGFIALAIRLAEALSFVKTVTSRLSIAALARVGGDARRLTRAVSDGMRLQVLALGPVLIAFTWIGGVVISLLFGRQWMPVLAVFPFVAVASLHHAAFNLHGSALSVIDRNPSVKLFNGAHVLLFATSALVLVPRYGLIGYGFAELLALPSYLLLHWQFVRHVGSPSSRVVLLWLAVFGVSLFAVEFKLGVAILLAAACAWPPSWRELRGLGSSMTAAWRTT